MKMKLTTHDRFLLKVDKVPGGCWEWKASVNKGYGQFHNGQKNVRAPRYAYEHYTGPIPEGLQLDHLCRNTKCVNPEHLEAVTNKVNTLRSNGISAQNARKTECLRGHPLSGENLNVNVHKGKVARRCKTCISERGKRWRAARRNLEAKEKELCLKKEVMEGTV